MFIPVYDNNPLQNHKIPFVNWLIILANFGVFFLFQRPLGIYETAFSLGLIPAIVNDLALMPPSRVWVPEEVTYVSHAFLHSDALHLIGNMIFLWVFGDNIEDAMGHWRYAVFYTLCAVAAGLADVFYDPASQIPGIGASGAVSGIIAAYLVLHPKMWLWIVVLGKIPLLVNALWCLGFWVAYQVYNFITYPESDILWISHIGGMVAGAILVPLFKYRHVPLFDRGLVSLPKWD